MYLRRYLGEEGVIANPDVFDPDYLPEELPFREGQMGELAREITFFARGNAPTNVLLWGPPGTGKTATVRKMLREASAVFPLRTVYVNAWKQRSRLSVLSGVASSLGIPVPLKGVSADLVLQRIEEFLEENRAIIAVDEADRLVGREDVLYDLSRLGKNALLITVANGRDFLSLIDRRVVSSLFQAEVEYPPYTVPQLTEILRQRAEAGLYPGTYDDQVLRACAAVGYSRGGDARVAITCLFNAAKRAEAEGSRRITLEHVKAARAALPERTPLEPHLSLIVRILREKGPLTTKEIYEEVRKSYNVTIRSIRNYVRELERLGLVKVSRAPRRGNVLVVEAK